jgi:glyoxalase/bleomycin resistance protein/dioxygenase superfamily protein
MTVLRELMSANDFTTAVKKLADPVSIRLDLPKAYHLGLVVADAVAADQAITQEWGVDPALIMDTEVGRWIENGKESRAKVRFGFSSHQRYELELIEPRQGADFYTRDLTADGDIHLHHLGIWVRDLDLQIARLTSQGIPLLVRGYSGSGPVSGNFAYFDTRPEFGIITELTCTRFLGIQARIPSPRLARYVGRRQIRSGKRVLSF